jgi:uncharacterized protein YgbK (DUF1537 family)
MGDRDNGPSPPWGRVPPVPPAATSGAIRSQIRGVRAATGRLASVLDDDPTGSQSVHGVQVVTALDPTEYGRALSASDCCFVLTNTRGQAEPDAVAANRTAAGDLFALAGRRGAPLDLVSRGDSTLRGHVLAEIGALHEARRAALGQGYDAVLLVPAYLEAGRVTVGDVHWARVGQRFRPVGETEFARDPTFGYRSSHLRDYLLEKSRGQLAADRVHSVSLADIRTGGPDSVAKILAGVGGGDLVVVNALDYSDLETVALAALTAAAAGRSLLYRTGPSFVRALLGQEPADPLTPVQIWPRGHPGGHGLIVVGSHVGQTSRQLAALRERLRPVEVVLDVPALLNLDRAGRGDYLEQLGVTTAEALHRADVLLLTSRSLVAAGTGAESLRIARQVSTAVATVTRRVLAAGPAWFLAKGGITSHDVAVHGLGIRRAEVVGQLFPGVVSLYRPTSADPRVAGRPFVVFAGNVGAEGALAEVALRMSDRGGD